MLGDICFEVEEPVILGDWETSSLPQTHINCDYLALSANVRWSSWTTNNSSQGHVIKKGSITRLNGHEL